MKNWIYGQGDGSQKSIVWISGGPGVGKSALLQTTCETLGADNLLDTEDTEGNFDDRCVILPLAIENIY